MSVTLRKSNKAVDTHRRSTFVDEGPNIFCTVKGQLSRVSRRWAGFLPADLDGYSGANSSSAEAYKIVGPCRGDSLRSSDSTRRENTLTLQACRERKPRLPLLTAAMSIGAAISHLTWTNIFWKKQTTRLIGAACRRGLQFLKLRRSSTAKPYKTGGPSRSDRLGSSDYSRTDNTLTLQTYRLVTPSSFYCTCFYCCRCCQRG